MLIESARFVVADVHERVVCDGTLGIATRRQAALSSRRDAFAR